MYKIYKLFWALFFAILPLTVSAQYSGYIGDYITLPEPTPPGNYELMQSVFSTRSTHLDVASGTSRVKILSYFSGHETVECNYTCVRQYTVAGHLYEDWQNGVAYYEISCLSNPDTGNDDPDNPSSGDNDSENPYTYDIDYGCWGTINIDEGKTYTPYCQFTIPRPEKVKSLKWSRYGSSGYEIVSQNGQTCVIKGTAVKSGQKLWCLMKYGNTSYFAHYIVNVNEKPKHTYTTVNSIEGIPIIYETKYGELTYSSTHRYSKTNAESIDVHCVAIPQETEGVVTIPEEAGGLPLEVIGTYTFRLCKNVSKVVMPSIREIYTGAFNLCGVNEIEFGDKLEVVWGGGISYCDNLKSLIFPNSLRRLCGVENCQSLEEIQLPPNLEYLSRFSNCPSLRKITSLMSTPVELSEDLVDINQLSTVELLVPKGSKEKYESAKYWKNFKNIVEMDDTNIPNLVTDERSIVEIYDLQGHKHSKPSKGINIINGKKVIVK